jgi:predicted membrane-bound spermidine synthase
MARTYYLLISASVGVAVLALQVVAARTLAPALGSGSVMWSALLAVALGMLAAGNLFGGLLSERALPCGVIAWSLAASSAYLLLLSRFYASAMRWSADCPWPIGTVTAALITQALPLGLLGLITPTILVHGKSGTGRWTGLVLAVGSGGGIVGALVAGLVGLPGLGIRRCYLCLAALLALAGMPAVWPQRRWRAGGVLWALLVAVAVCWYRSEPGTVEQSRYGQIEVHDTPTARILLIDGLPQTGLPADLMPGDGLRYGYLLEAALALRPNPTRALVIGLGAGLAPRLLAARGIDCTSVEIDPKVVEIARSKFGFEGRTAIADGRVFLMSATSPQYDLIFLDVCTADRLACHLFTVEALRALRNRLAPDGIAVIQCIGDDGPWSASVIRTVDTVFGRSLMLAGSGEVGRVGPRWLFATRSHRPDLGQEPLFPPTGISCQVTRPSELGALLTDDHFATELDWARTAVTWRSLCAARPRRP